MYLPLVGVFSFSKFPTFVWLLPFVFIAKFIFNFVSSTRRRQHLNSNIKITEDIPIVPSKVVPDDVQHIALNFRRLSDEDQAKISSSFLNSVKNYPQVKKFSSKKVPKEIIENCLKTAGTSPSGVHTEPWTFAVVSNPDLKKQIRHLVESEEYKNVSARASLKKDVSKAFLEEASHLIVIFKQVYGVKETGERQTHYQNQVTVAVATGVLIAAFQNVGVSSIACATPQNVGPLLRRLLKRPINEKALFLLPVGYADEIAPPKTRKSLPEIMKVFS